MVDHSGLNIYLEVPYVDGGRTMDGLDCWGLVRLILHEHYKQPLLESFGTIFSADKEDMFNAYQKMLPKFVECAPRDGCIAACFKREILLHVGVVVVENGLNIYHTKPKVGASKTNIAAFERGFFRVKYHGYNPSFP